MISVIVCSIDPAKYADVAAQYRRLFANDPFELIGIHDARSLAEGYNRGIARSRGEILVFSHDDIEILTPGLAERLRAHLARFDVIGVAGASRTGPGPWHAAGPPFLFGQVAHPTKAGGYQVLSLGGPAPAVPDVQVLDGLFLACRRAVVERHRFDEVTFDGFHGYDVDFTFGAFLAGFRIAVCTDIAIVHQSTGDFGERWAAFNERYAKKYRGRFTATAPRAYELPWVEVADKAEAARRLTPWYAPAREVARAAPVAATAPETIANLRVLFVGARHDVPYTVDHCTRLNGLFAQIAAFRPDVIVTTDTMPASLGIAPFEIRKRWIHVASGIARNRLLRAIEDCYIGGLWGHPNQHLQPLVSVYTGVFNTGDFLRDTYQSLREQTYNNWEWIVVDDGSVDGTWERVLAIASEDCRVRPFRMAHTGRIGTVKDVATRLATGVYLVELDHDDMLTDDALAEIKDAFTANPDAGMVYSNCAEFFQDGRPSRYGGEFWADRYREARYRGKTYLECRTPDVYGAFGPLPSDQFAWYLTVGPNHVRAFRADELRRLGGYTAALPVADDWDLFARFFLRSKIVHLDRLLYLYRFLDSAGNTTFVRNKSIQDHLRVARAHYAEEFALANARRLERQRAVALAPGRRPKAGARASSVRNVLVTALVDRAGVTGRRAWPSQLVADAAMVVDRDQDVVFFTEGEVERALVERRESRGLLARTRVVAASPASWPGAGKTAGTVAKLSLLRRVMSADPFRGTHFAWIDADLAAAVPRSPQLEDVLERPTDAVRLLAIEDAGSPRGFRVAAGYIAGRRGELERLCRFVGLAVARARGGGPPPSEEDLLTDAVVARPELFDLYWGGVAETFENHRVLRGGAARILDQMRRFRALEAHARTCAIGAAILESHSQGTLGATPIELSALLDEYFVAAYYLHAPDQTLARSIALHYIALADRDPKFLAAFLLDLAHIRTNFGFLRDPVL